jgi:hypothetical protein
VILLRTKRVDRAQTSPYRQSSSRFPALYSPFPFSRPTIDQFAEVDLLKKKPSIVFRQAYTNAHLQVSLAFANAGAKPRAPIPALVLATTMTLRAWERTAELGSIDAYWSRYMCGVDAEVVEEEEEEEESLWSH